MRRWTAPPTTGWRPDPYLGIAHEQRLRRSEAIAQRTNGLWARDALPTDACLECGFEHGYEANILSIVCAQETLAASFCASARAGRCFGDREVEVCRVLLPHVATALQMRYDWVDRMQPGLAGLATLDHLGAAVFICGSDARVVHRNPAADDLLASTDSPVAMIGDRIAARHTDDTARIRSAIRRAADDRGAVASSRFLIGSVSSERPVTVLVATATDHSLDPRVASVMVNQPDHVSRGAGHRLEQVFHLTRTESRVAARLLRGDTLQQAARGLGVSRETAKTHLLRLFDKTDTRCQADLMRALIGACCAGRGSATSGDASPPESPRDSRLWLRARQ